MNSQTKTTAMTPHVDVKRLHDLLEQQKAAYQRHPVPSAKERIERLARLKNILVKYQDQFANAISQDYGNRAIMETKIGEVLTCLEHIKYYSKNLTEWMKPSKRHISMLHQPAKGWVEYQPLGVIGVIAPWNYPLLLSVGPLICALAAGNHAMIKISSASSNFGYVLENALAEAFPQELVAVVNGGGVISDAFSHLAFDKMIFTGSTSVGKTVMAAAAENLVPVILELGGKSPALVHSAMNIRDVAQRIAVGKLWNAGQTCVCANRIYVHDKIYQAFTEKFVQEVQKFKIGNGLESNVQIGPLINDKAVLKAKQLIDDACAKGAQVACGGQQHALGQTFFEPTVLTDVSRDMDIVQEEIFGPVAPLIRFTDEADVVAQANDTIFGLAAYVYSENISRIWRVAEQLEYGMVGMNSTAISNEVVPFGGVKQSGVGREGSKYGLEEFMTIKYMCLGL